MMYFAYTCYDVTLISTQCHKDVNVEKMDRLEKCHLSFTIVTPRRNTPCRHWPLTHVRLRSVLLQKCKKQFELFERKL